MWEDTLSQGGCCVASISQGSPDSPKSISRKCQKLTLSSGIPLSRVQTGFPFPQLPSAKGRDKESVWVKDQGDGRSNAGKENLLSHKPHRDGLRHSEQENHTEGME